MFTINLKKRKKRIKNKLLQSINDPIFKIGFILFLIIILTMSLFYIFEKKANPEKLKNLLDSFYYTITTLATVGYGDITPLTYLGKIIAIISMIFGVILVATVTGKFSSFLIDQQFRRGKGLLKLKKLQDHFIICGWKNDFEKIIEEIIETNPEFDISDIVLINNSPAEQMEQFMANSKFKLISFIYGDYIDESVLLRANIQNAKRILILADTSLSYNPIEIDSKTVMAVITIKKLNRNIYTIAELLDEKFEKYLQISHCDEILLSRQYERALLVNASSGSGVSHVIRDLLKVENKQKIVIY
ncbi:MAG: NAD-binding protein, partial [Spirochaetes bacterium]|nr:NAD-binding protein [Spirochaetota bacterium]